MTIQDDIRHDEEKADKATKVSIHFVGTHPAVSTDYQTTVKTKAVTQDDDGEERLRAGVFVVWLMCMFACISFAAIVAEFVSRIPR